MNWIYKITVTFCFLVFTTNNFAQEGQVDIHQDINIDVLLNAKKQLNKTEINPDRYKIQIFDGDRHGANTILKEFNKLFNEWKAIDKFEKPVNFKIWVGNFRTRLEADRVLKRIRKEFPSAFIFKPKKEKN